jgi:Zn-dependent protease with chaperone function
MRPSRAVIVFWSALITILLLVELAEITRSYTLPIQTALGDPLAVVIALLFTSLLALVGAIFIGIWVSHRLWSPSTFTPFEEEMLRMRAEVRDLKKAVEARETAERASRKGPAPPPGGAP